jgi:hypothetical protein
MKPNVKGLLFNSHSVGEIEVLSVHPHGDALVALYKHTMTSVITGREVISHRVAIISQRPSGDWFVPNNVIAS